MELWIALVIAAKPVAAVQESFKQLPHNGKNPESPHDLIIDTFL